MGTITERPLVRRTAAVVAICVLYLVLAAMGRELGVFGALSVWFPPAGLALALGYLWGWRALPVIAVAEFTSGIVVFGIAEAFSPAQMVLNATGYATVYVGTAVLLRHHLGQPRLASLGRALPLMVVTVAACALVAALFGVGMRTWAGLDATTPYLRSVLIWWLGDAIGIATVLPAAIIGLTALRHGSVRVPTTLRARPPLVTGVTLLLPAATAVLVLAADIAAVGLLFLLAVPITVVATRHGTAGMALSTLVFSPGATWAANTFQTPAGVDRVDLQLLLLGMIAAGHLVGAAVDQNDRLYAQLATRESHLDHAQDLAGMGSFRYDVTNDTSSWSAGLHRLYGRSPEDGPVTFAAYLAGIHPDDRGRVADAVHSLLEAPGTLEHQYRIPQSGGPERWVEARIESRTDAFGEVTEVVGTCQDVTAWRAADEALRAAVDRERLAAEQIMQGERLQNALLVAVSHEVRTPLSLALGFAETLQRSDLSRQPELYPRVAARLHRSLRRLQHLLEDLLDTERLQRGAVQAARRAVSLPELMAEVRGDHELEGRSLHVDLPTEPVWVDRGLVSRILHQLVGNAARYTPVDVPVWVWAERQGDDLLLVVDDAGQGVRPEARAQVFAPFHQDLRIDHAPGTGVGLHLVARFAELHDGAAWVEDRHGGGASFRVRLGGVTLPERVEVPQRMPPGE